MQLRFRNVEMKDLEQIMPIEEAGFTPDEAATKRAMIERIQIIPDSFIVVENKEQRVVGYVVWPVTEDRYIQDELFEKTKPNPIVGGFQTILSLAIHPDFQGAGIGQALLSELSRACIERKREGITLTCLERLIPYYEKNSFSNEGLSESTHGGEQWFNLVKELKQKKTK